MKHAFSPSRRSFLKQLGTAAFAAPFVTSGLRLGTAACTSRGFDEAAFREVADVIAALRVAGAEVYVHDPLADAAEARELKKRIRLLEQENEVLRRAAAYLSQANLRLGGSPK